MHLSNLFPTDREQDADPDLLALTTHLQHLASPPAGPRAVWRGELLQRLLRSYSQTPHPSRAWIWGVAVLLATTVLAVFFLSLPSSGPASAAELLDRANQQTFDLAAGDVVHDSFRLDVSTAWVHLEGARVERWQSADGAWARLEVLGTGGELLYFAQSDGDELWRSVHIRPVGAEALVRVYRGPRAAFSARPDLPPLNSWFVADLAVPGLFVDPTEAKGSEACLDLYCLLGLEAPEWSCADGLCLSSRTGWQARMRRSTPAADVEVELIPAGGETEWSRVLTLDAQSGRVLSIADYDRGQQVAHLEWISRTALSGRDLPQDFSRQVPEGVEVLNLPSPGVSPCPLGERLCLLSVTPQAGTPLSGERANFILEIGYDLGALPEAAIFVIFARPGWEAYTSGRAPLDETSGPFRVTSDRDRVTLSIPVDVRDLEWLAQVGGEVTLYVRLGVFQGASYFEVVAQRTFEEYRWPVLP